MQSTQLNQHNNFIVKYKNVNFQNIVYDDFVLASDKNHVVAKLWYKHENVEQPHTFFIQTTPLKIYQVPENENDDLLVELNDISVFENLDLKSVEQVKFKEAHKKYGLIKPTYKSTLSTFEENRTLETLRLRIDHSKFFYKDKKPKKIQEILKNKLLQKGMMVKLIIQIDSIVMNIEQNFIFTNIILRQVQIFPLLPKIVELSEYSFIDDDEEFINNEIQQSQDMNDMTLNTQTEYNEEKYKLSDSSDKLNLTDDKKIKEKSHSDSENKNVVVKKPRGRPKKNQIINQYINNTNTENTTKTSESPDLSNSSKSSNSSITEDSYYSDNETDDVISDAKELINYLDTLNKKPKSKK